MNKELIKQIQSEIKFLGCQGMRHLVWEADLGACHELSKTVENRKKKLKELIRLSKQGSKS